MCVCVGGGGGGGESGVNELRLLLYDDGGETREKNKTLSTFHSRVENLNKPKPHDVDPHFTLARHRVSSSSVVRASD